ncbi:methylase of polypeptide subunit release factors [Paucimonas lemoignei]|uniref:Methylase of polypeptide subunit release factors n=1 Tax=Paucimonas lemoignei TaxID=29443 RepID=A0A4R3HRJ6_PAULE|nr:class I SAM-dependent methyltransferase [Paucimonas lemoignei]TCS33741.1 methylase of polypeptide subunit release factors [Paucimonas lemoignei]
MSLASSLSTPSLAGAAVEQPQLCWNEAGENRCASWRAEGGATVPKRVVIGDDTLAADTAYRLACEGTAILWRGDFQNARQLLQALARRLDGKGRRKGGKKPKAAANITEAFHFHRQAQAQRARVLGMLLIPFDADYGIPLRRAPDVRQACREAYGDNTAPFVTSLRELQGIIGAHEWRKKGVEIPVLGARIHPHYGVFSPVRGEYLELVVKAPLPANPLPQAFDIGTGTGVLAALLARRGATHVVATDCAPRALACARDNIQRLQLEKQVDIVEADLFPPGQAPLIVCNPPWLPARPSSALEQAVYDPDSRMLRGFLTGVGAHLAPGGEAWLILSDLAEHLGLRSREDLLGWIDAAGLKVAGRLDARPIHPKASDPDDPLHAARRAEVTSLWRLAAK